ncbi:TIGR02680 family protein [Anaerotalea alkaliphila]|uniref:TIGR02680 family protein n=1 Tax=Anaerotalea alkaliphila TaxID=2662126 RepID=A0A7X5HUT7_9FIRM|nr:TIGR02680 family protein [Anaerotalea alkaliphila]NDL66791.1 TIGR02680 family protein [Anaerotalea alkaliphila]
MTEQWTASRAGVINFWYYDEETFHFEEGRLLLRGANGSGKSVTMQSLVPLLFDGNKSPERLDPFGSKARKMESYLLSDGLDLEERTGYLFLEFGKPEAGRYITIGMGMRARKNMPMQTWYFILRDNRRIGKGHDLSLYKDIGDRIPLTQRELENRIGSGGHVYTRQSDYKAAVNECLFGYADLADFDELIALLIQIRSPKLSKEFKPTTMYEIMQNSLVTLSDEDLRPMSEAIENMDEIKLKIDALQASKRSLGRIQGAYDRYNQYMLAVKARRFLGHLEAERRVEGNGRRLQEEEKGHQARLQALEGELQQNARETEQRKAQEESLREHDLTRLAEEAETHKERIRDLEQVAGEKTVQLEAQVEKEKSFGHALREKQGQLESWEGEIAGLLDALAGTTEATQFDEHAFFADEYGKAGEACDFTHHRKQVQRHEDRIREGHQALLEQDRLGKAYEAALLKVDAATRKKEAQARLLQETERQFNQVKEEFAEKAFAWKEKADVLHLEREVLQQVTERVYGYGERYRFDEALEPLRTAYEDRRDQVTVQRNKLQSKVELLEESIREAEAERGAIQGRKEPEPVRTEAVLANRNRLQEKGIPHVPLYKAIDFAGDLEEGLRGTLEEALEDMGVLDALIVPPEHRVAVESMDPGMADKYLFASPEFLSHNLSDYLRGDPEEAAVSRGEVQDVLMSILLDDAPDRWFVREDGRYGMGILQGKASGRSDSRFIGAASRKRYRLRLIAEVQARIDALREAAAGAREEAAGLEEKLEAMRKAWLAFPGPQDLEVAHKEWSGAAHMLSLFLKEEAHYQGESEKVYGLLKEARTLVIERTQGLYLAKTVEAFEAAREGMGEYVRLFGELVRMDQSRWFTLENMERIRERLEDCLAREEDLRRDLLRQERSLGDHRGRLGAIEEQLKVSGFEEVKAAFLACRKRLEELPEEYRRLVEERARLEADCGRIGRELEMLQVQKDASRRLRRLYEAALAGEWALGHVLEPGDVKDTEGMAGLAMQVLALHGGILEENRTVVELREAVNERFLRELGELAEYHLKGTYLFGELCGEDVGEDDKIHIIRMDLGAKVQGKPMKFNELSLWIDGQIKEQGSLLSEQDRALFEEILINSVSRKISAKIFHSERWVEKIDELMGGMDTSSGLSFHLRWVTKAAESEDQLGTKELVEILKGDQSLLGREQKDRLIAHFQSKIAESKSRAEEGADARSFLAIMKEVLDYRKWFQFQLSYTKKGERRKELTNNAFFTFSGGEKAMAMYVPLFSAVYAKYSGGGADCPKMISLDEAFAGVDEKNIQDMFRLLVKELKLSFIANSQVLFGDYETVPALGIYELIRPENVTFVTSIRYRWNGKVRMLVDEGVGTDEAGE